MTCAKCGQTASTTIARQCLRCHGAEHPEEVSHACKYCGDITLKHSFVNSVQASLQKYQLCFYCHFWEVYTPDLDRGYPDKVLVVEKEPGVRVHYVIGDEPGSLNNRGFLGFGGSRFNIEFLDGRKVVTHNLWHQGDIPERFYHLYPVNGRFARNDS